MTAIFIFQMRISGFIKLIYFIEVSNYKYRNLIPNLYPRYCIGAFSLPFCVSIQRSIFNKKLHWCFTEAVNSF